jgi:hypothetical protein
MTSTTPNTPAIVRSNVPGTRVMRAVNLIVSAILRSPLLRKPSGSLHLLTFTGHRTGKASTISVGYTDCEETPILFMNRPWRRCRRG